MVILLISVLFKGSVFALLNYFSVLYWQKYFTLNILHVYPEYLHSVQLKQYKILTEKNKYLKDTFDKET